MGLVACHWTAGEDQEAEAYYPAIEGMLGDRCVCVCVSMSVSHTHVHIHVHVRVNM